MPAVEALEDRVMLTVDVVSKPGFDADNVEAQEQQVSDDGRYVVFVSFASNVVVGQIDTNDAADVFLFDRLTGVTSLLSHTGDGVTTGNRASSGPVISGDGSRIAFHSNATDLMAGVTDENGTSRDVFAWSAGTLTLISHSAADPLTTGNEASNAPVISADGSTIAYISSATNIVTGQVDTNATFNLFASSGGVTTLVNRSAAGPTATANDNVNPLELAISDDGNAITFVSAATDLVPDFVDSNGPFSSDVYLFTGGVVSLVSHSTAGLTTGGNDHSAGPIISGDGSTVVFLSRARDLVAGFVDNNSPSGYDVFTSTAGATLLVSHTTAGPGISGNEGSGATGISANGTTGGIDVNADGSVIVFLSRATDLVSGQVDTNNERDIFRSTSGVVTLVSHSTTGPTTTGNAFSNFPVISSDGGRIAFSSLATDLVPGLIDTNNTLDVFSASGGMLSLVNAPPASPMMTGVAPASGPIMSGDGSTIVFRTEDTRLMLGGMLASVSSLYAADASGIKLASPRQGTPDSTASDISALTGDRSGKVSDDGRLVVFESLATNLVAGQIDENRDVDVFLLDRATGVVSLLSHTGDGVTTGNDRSRRPAISGDGNTVVFESEATDLVANFTDANGVGGLDLFAWTGGTVTLVSHSTSGATTGGDGQSFDASISDDGSVIAFRSFATDLVSGFVDENLAGGGDVFSSSGGAISLVSHSPAGPTTTGNSSSYSPVVSGDGGTIVFSSLATDLVAGQVDGNFGSDVFASAGGTLTLISHSTAGATITGNKTASEPVISDDGGTIAFESGATDLVAGFVDNNGTQKDVFAWSGGVITLISHSTAGLTESGNFRSDQIVISGDGTTFAFRSFSTDLVAGFVDVSWTSSDIFSSSGGTITLISHSPAGATTTGNSSSLWPVISHDGGTIAFESQSTNLVSGLMDVNGVESDVFVASGGTVALVSHAVAGSLTTGNTSSEFPIISGNGAAIIFSSRATDLALHDNNRTTDVFVFGRLANSPPTVDDLSFSISEDAAANDLVGTVVASDPDVGQQLTFSIIGGNTGAAFAINPQTGEITVARGLDQDSRPQYLLSIEVTDNGSPQLSDIATITIDVTQTNEPPVVDNRQFTITEDSDMGFVVGSVPASDPNMGQQLTFTITAGDPDGRFAIDPNSGQITVALNGVLNAQTTPQFVLTVEVTDNGSPPLSDTATVTINVIETPSNVEVYVNDDFTLPDNTVIEDADPNTPGNQLAVIGANAFNSIQEAIDAVARAGSVYITDDLATDGPATYFENLVIDDYLQLLATDGAIGAVTIDGGAAGRVLTITASENEDVQLRGLVIQNGLETDGGGIQNRARLTVTSSLIQNNAAAENGGGIHNRGDLTLVDTRVTGNAAGGLGGGIHVSDRSARIDASTIDGNTAVSGGGIFNSANGLLITRNGSTISGNTATGTEANEGGGGIYNNGGRLAVQAGTTISQNHATGAGGSGGGIFTSNGVVTLDESTVTSNSATRAGGGIEFVTGVLELTNAQVDDNAATGGGAETPGDGGGIHVTGRAGQVGYIRVIGGSVSGNTAARQGGGLWNQQGNIMVVRGGAVVDGNTASGDAASDGGGGIFNRGGRLSIGEGVAISNNVADGVAGSGGGIFSTGSGVSIAGGTVISGNSANRSGGGVEVIDGLVTINDSTIENNTAGQGGGVHITGTNFTRVDLWNSIVRNNSAATQGGGLWNQVNGVMLVRVGSQVTGNTAGGDAADDGGGGIYNQGGRLIINNATIDGNNADGTAGSGGGVFTRNGVVTVENATISNNTAHRAGGGVEIIDGWFYTRNMDLTSNNAGGTAPNPGDGGGLHVTGTNLSRVRIDGGTIADNTAAGSGGGLWHQTGSLMVIFGGTTIAGNTAAGDATDAGGGGIFNAGGRLAITAATLSGNSASGTNGAGGGILSLGGGLTLDNSTVSGNSANGNGGGIVSNGDLIAANATIVGNRSDADGVGGSSGGGLFNGGLATINNTMVAGNLVGAGSAANDLAGNNLWPTSAHTIVGDVASAGGLTHGTSGNIVGNAGVGVLALASIVNPTLASNGGPTLTHALAQNSPAINAGSNNLAKDVAGMAFTTDQRGIGFPRIVNNRVDIGAFEV